MEVTVDQAVAQSQTHRASCPLRRKSAPCGECSALVRQLIAVLRDR